MIPSYYCLEELFSRMHIWADKNTAIAASCFIYIEIVWFRTRPNEVALILYSTVKAGKLKLVMGCAMHLSE